MLYCQSRTLLFRRTHWNRHSNCHLCSEQKLASTDDDRRELPGEGGRGEGEDVRQRGLLGRHHSRQLVGAEAAAAGRCGWLQVLSVPERSRRVPQRGPSRCGRGLRQAEGARRSDCGKAISSQFRNDGEVFPFDLQFHAEMCHGCDGSSSEDSGSEESVCLEEENPQKYQTFLKMRPQSLEVNAIKMISVIAAKYDR